MILWICLYGLVRFELGSFGGYNIGYGMEGNKGVEL